MFIRTPSSSMHFFSFFDVLPSATGMTLMLLMFHIFLFLSLVSGISQLFLLFSLALMSPSIAISIMTQLLSLLFTAIIFDFLALISLLRWIITSHKIFTSSTTPSRACSYHFPLLFRLYFSHNFR